MSRLFSSFSCLSGNIPDSPAHPADKPVPTIGLVNGLSGGHKGEKVLRILNKAKIPTFDLILLSTDDAYFKSFIHKFVEIYDEIIMDELSRVKSNTDDSFHLHPRILIGGGDGSMAWALSILDRALLDPELVRIFWRRSRIISNISGNVLNINDNNSDSIKEQLSHQSVISEEFYYSNTATLDDDDPNPIDPLDDDERTHTTHSPFNSTKPTENQLIHEPAQLESQTDIENDGNISSASLSAVNEAQIIEDFMSQDLPNHPSPTKHDRLCEKQRLKDMKRESNSLRIYIDDIDLDDDNGEREIKLDDSLSESLVTQEQLASVRHQKSEAAEGSNLKSTDDLRVLQGIYDCRVGPAIALIPLGTGNDLSRCLGTGFAYPGSKELVQNLISEYRKASLTKLDRWKIKFIESDNYTLKHRQTSEMLCYFSVGYEGQIAYKFAQARSKNPKLFDRPWKNKIQYMLSGIGTSVEQTFGATKPLNNAIEVYVDGERLKLPSNTRSLVVSNIQSMADGVYFWGKGPNTKKDFKEYTEPKLGDGKLEVMAAKGIYKYLQMRLNMSHYRRLAQPKKVRIVTKVDLPIQIDGESWIESEGSVEIYLLHQVFAVVGKNEPRGVRII